MHNHTGRAPSLGPILLALTTICPCAHAQLFINEVYLNPPGFAETEDSVWEFIELYGEPGMPLDGYAVVLIKHEDEPIYGERVEVDEAFALDGYRLSGEGLFTLVNTSEEGFSAAAGVGLTPAAGYEPELGESGSNPRWVNGASFGATHIQSHQPSRMLSNDGRATTLLVLRSLDVAFGSAESGWRKDVLIDVDRDGEIDAMAERTTQGEKTSGRLDHVELVDAVAWRSRPGGRVYAPEQCVLSDVDGFIPDAVTRLRIYAEHPGLGHRTANDPASDEGFRILPTTLADESFIAGEILDADELGYITGFNTAGWQQVIAPTDPAARRFTGECDPEPDGIPMPRGCFHAADGMLAFYDLSVDGMRLTPGALNDHPDGRLKQDRLPKREAATRP